MTLRPFRKAGVFLLLIALVLSGLWLGGPWIRGLFAVSSYGPIPSEEDKALRRASRELGTQFVPIQSCLTPMHLVPGVDDEVQIELLEGEDCALGARYRVSSKRSARRGLVLMDVERGARLFVEFQELEASEPPPCEDFFDAQGRRNWRPKRSQEPRMLRDPRQPDWIIPYRRSLTDWQGRTWHAFNVPIPSQLRLTDCIPNSSAQRGCPEPSEYW